MTKPCRITDSIHGVITLSGYERDIMSTEAFNRLHDVYQNSVVFLTLPCNRTKRFEHSIGTMSLCSEMFLSAVTNTPDERLRVFLRVYHKEIKGLKRDTLFADDYQRGVKLGITGIETAPIPDKYIMSLVPRNVPKKYRVTCAILLESIRVAALLHDIGHPPFSHVVESAMNSLYHKSIAQDSKPGWASFKKLMKSYFDDGAALHEQMGYAISRTALMQAIPNADSTTREEHPESLYLMLVRLCALSILHEDSRFKDLHRIIDSSLDGDRLDYVSRDPLNSGFKVGMVNYERIISGMTIIDMGSAVNGAATGRFAFSFPVRATGSIEDFLQRRFDLYRDVVYHHRTTLMSDLLKSCVYDLASISIDKMGRKEARRLASARTSMQIPMQIQGLWYPLSEGQTQEESSRGLSQWNDAWLMTVLRQTYYSHYYANPEEEEFNHLSDRLAELLDNRRMHRSLVKRCEDFRVLDGAAKAYVVSNSADLKESLIAAAKETSKVLNDTTSSPRDPKKTTPYRRTLDVMMRILLTSQEEQSMLYPLFMDNLQAFHNLSVKPEKSLSGRQTDIESIRSSVESRLRKLIADAIERALPERPGGHDVIVDFSKPSIGIGKHEIVMHDDSNEVFLLRQVSSIQDRLWLQSSFMPGFWLYAIIDADHYTRKSKMALLKEAGSELGKYIVQCMRDELARQELVEPKKK